MSRSLYFPGSFLRSHFRIPNSLPLYLICLNFYGHVSNTVRITSRRAIAPNPHPTVVSFCVWNYLMRTLLCVAFQLLFFRFLEVFSYSSWCFPWLECSCQLLFSRDYIFCWILCDLGCGDTYFSSSAVVPCTRGSRLIVVESSEHRGLMKWVGIHSVGLRPLASHSQGSLFASSLQFTGKSCSAFL